MDKENSNLNKDHSKPILGGYKPKAPGSKKNLRRALYSFGFLALALLGLYLVLSQRGEKSLANWNEAIAKTGSIKEMVQVSGSIELNYSRTVLSPESGTLVLHVANEGAWINSGDIVAHIYSPDLENTLEDTENGIATSRRDIYSLESERKFALEKQAIDTARKERQYKEALTALDRARELLEAGTGTQKEVADREKAVLEADEALVLDDIAVRESAHNYNLKKQNLEDKLMELEKTRQSIITRIASLKVQAPMSGRVLSWSAREGAEINKGAALLILADTTNALAVFSVPETSASKLEQGMAVSITVGSNIYPGKINSIGMEATASTDYGSTVKVSATFDGETPEFASGASASGSIMIGQKDDAILLPRGAYLSSGSSYVFRIEDGIAYKTAVQFGASEGGMIEVISGIDDGDRVIISEYSQFLDRESIKLGGRK